MVTVVAPVTVILEKILLFQLEVTVVELPADEIPVTVPPAPVLLNAVTIELLFIVWLPPAGTVMLLEMKVTLPVVFTVILVNVLELIEVVRLRLATVIKVIVPLAATVWPNVLKLLLLTFKTLVVVAEPDGYEIPTIEPAARPLCNEMVLLLILFVNVPVGATEAPGI